MALVNRSEDRAGRGVTDCKPPTVSPAEGRLGVEGLNRTLFAKFLRDRPLQRKLLALRARAGECTGFSGEPGWYRGTTPFRPWTEGGLC